MKRNRAPLIYGIFACFVAAPQNGVSPAMVMRCMMRVSAG
jgi:hypothetical protein